MADQPNVINTLINPVMVQQFERYLPTAFDEGMTLLEKMNKVVITLNRMGKVSNDVLDQWNQVMDWVMADGMDAAVDSKLDAMTTDGTLANIINTNIFNTLNSEVSQNTSSIATLNTNVSNLTTSVSSTNTDLSNTKTDLTNQIATKAYKVYGTPEEYGAKGDGVTDDTQAIQNCLNANLVTHFNPVTYMISKTLVLPENASIDGNHGEIRVMDSWIASNNGASVPQNTVLYVKGRQPTWESELDMESRFVRNLRIRGNSNISSLTGMYLGTEDISQITQSSCVNYAVYGTNFDNISIFYVNNGLTLSEAWACNFNNVFTSKITGTACYIIGQIVNNTFLGCKFGTSAAGGYGVYAVAGTYNGQIRQSEGNSFIGGFIGEATNGIRVDQALALKFSNVIVDLNTNNAVVGSNFDDVTFDHCYLHATNAVVALNTLDSIVNDNYLHFTGCNFSPEGTSNSVYVNSRQNGIIIDGCLMLNQVYFADGCSATIRDCVWSENDDNNARIVHSGTGYVTATNNTFKYTGNAVVTSGTR